jgi:hypothetical protein
LNFELDPSSFRLCHPEQSRFSGGARDLPWQTALWPSVPRRQVTANPDPFYGFVTCATGLGLEKSYFPTLAGIT